MQLINLRHVTFKQALTHAKLLSGKTNAEICEESGLSPANVPKYFKENEAYYPSPCNIPSLCRALGNTVLVDWLNAQIEDMRESVTIGNAEELTRAVMRATKNTGALNAKTLVAIEDGGLTQAEAQELQAQFRANSAWNAQSAKALEPLASGNIQKAVRQ